MSLMPRDPFEVMMPLREAMSRLFEESFIGPGRLELFFGRSFPLDIYETDDRQQYVVEAVLPGFKPEDVQVTAMGDTLTIRAGKKREEKAERGSYVRRERYEGEMLRTVSLPAPIDAEKVQASYEHGVLTLRIPKAEEAKPKQIPIQTKQAVGTP